MSKSGSKIREQVAHFLVDIHKLGKEEMRSQGQVPFFKGKAAVPPCCQDIFILCPGIRGTDIYERPVSPECLPLGFDSTEGSLRSRILIMLLVKFLHCRHAPFR